MNARERTLLIALVAILAGGVGLYAAKRWWWDPLQDYNRTIERLTDDNEQLDFKLATFYKDRKKLALARMKSLPSKPDQAESEYMAYLGSLLPGSGLKVEVLDKTSIQKVKVVTPIPNVKEVGHQIISFTVRVRGELDQLVKAMEKMQKTPYEHRIRNLTIDRVDATAKKDGSNRLTVGMIIETLLVAKSDNKASQPPGFDSKSLLAPTPPDRNYALIAEKNIFVGATPYRAPEENDQRPPEDTPRYVYLTQTVPEQQTAYLRNRIYPTAEMKVIANKPGWDEFQITDEFGNYVFFRAKVLKVEQRQIFFQIGRSRDPDFPSNSVFAVQIGTSLAQAKDYSFNKTRIDLEDDGLYDKNFEMREAAKGNQEHKDNKGRPTGKNGKGKKGR
jgi:hypothetical protein